jgi:hypothetical protein
MKRYHIGQDPVTIHRQDNLVFSRIPSESLSGTLVRRGSLSLSREADEIEVHTVTAGTGPQVRDERLPHGGLPVRPCEFNRAYAELIAPRLRHARPPVDVCSPEGPEERSFPSSPAGSPTYSLCNGHLRDLFALLEECRSAGSPA